MSDISSETLLLSLLRFRENNLDVAFDPDKLAAQMLAATEVGPPSNQGMSVSVQTADSEIVTMELRMRILSDADATIRRYKRLITIAEDDSRGASTPDLEIIRRLTTETLRLPRSMCDQSRLSADIVRIYSIVLAKLDQREGKTSHMQSQLTRADGEACTVCNKMLPFESLRWARCSNGHQFPRCSLTFLAIQAPGMTKSCVICNSQCLNEYLIDSLVPHSPSGGENTGAKDDTAENNGGPPGILTQGVVQREPMASLIRVLFAACDICIYCGGKFAG